MQAKIEAPAPIIKENLSALVKNTDLGNMFDNNNKTITTAITQKNSLQVDFSQIEFTEKDNHSATLTAKPDSTNYYGSVDVTYNVVQTTIVDLKIYLKSTSSEAIVVKDYVGQIDTSNITHQPRSDFLLC